MVEIKIFVADTNYPSRLALNSFSTFAEVTRGEQKRLFRFHEKSSHKCVLKLIEHLEKIHRK